MSYVMESRRETERLVAQARADPATQRLLDAGLRKGMRVLDLGCGPGVISERIADLVGSTGAVLGIDQSAARIDEARRRSEGRPELQFRVGDARSLDAPDASFDFCWSQFVLEYFGDRAAVLNELRRVTRPGGKVVISEIDGVGFGCWPFPQAVERGLATVAAALAETGFDVYVGRKLYAEMRALGFVDVTVRLYPQYVVAGAADQRMLEDWRTRFDALRPVAEPRFGGALEYASFCEQYLELLASPEALKFAVLLVTEGTVST